MIPQITQEPSLQNMIRNFSLPQPIVYLILKLKG